jgi:hypothetical protein
MGDKQQAKKISVVIVPPNGKAKTAKIDRTREAMQKVVGGPYKTYKSFDDRAVIVCNENDFTEEVCIDSALDAKTGELRFRGIAERPFFICYIASENETFCSLPREQAQKYKEMFQYCRELYEPSESGEGAIRRDKTKGGDPNDKKL